MGGGFQKRGTGLPIPAPPRTTPRSPHRARRLKALAAMRAETLERLLETVLRGGRAGPRELCDAIGAYLALAGGLPAGEAAERVRRAFEGRRSTHDRPAMADLVAVLAWVDREHPPRPAHARVRTLIDELGLQAAVRERLQVLARPRRRRFAAVDGGRESSPPRGRLTLVREEPPPAAPEAGAQ
jgi:hypothetical protein